MTLLRSIVGIAASIIVLTFSIATGAPTSHAAQRNAETALDLARSTPSSNGRSTLHKASPNESQPVPEHALTSDDGWSKVYRAASGIVLLGAALFFGTTIGLGRTAMTRGHSRRDPARRPGTHATRTQRSAANPRAITPSPLDPNAGDPTATANASEQTS